METALHGHNTLTGQNAENKIAAMPLHCRHREVGDFRIWDNGFVLYHIGQRAKAGAEDYCQFGHIVDFRTKEIGSLFDFF